VQGFFADFARIADDESRHFGWCAQRLRELGHEYGCMPAHDLLWQGAQRSSGAWAILMLPPFAALAETFLAWTSTAWPAGQKELP